MDEFNKFNWLGKLQDHIHEETATVVFPGLEDCEPISIITIEDLEKILQYYFPQIKLTQHDRTSTNTGDNSPELASHIAAIIQQSEDEDDTGTSATDVQVVSI